MKRLFAYGLVLVSAFALTNCTEQIVTPDQEESTIDEIVENITSQEEGDKIPFEVYVNTVETKTVTQDNQTFWVDEYTAKTYGLTQDAIFLYSYPASETDESKQKFTNHQEFRYNGNGRFLGEVHDNVLSSTNNWYCIYPYKEVSMSNGNNINTIKETLTIGAKKSDGYIQVQTGLATMSHIAGENYPMYGILNNVAITKSPKFSMNHLFALVELEIQNLGDKIANQKETEVVIENIEFTAPEAIVGDFDVTISGSQPTYEPTSDVSSKAIVNFTGSTVSIPTGNSAKVYFAVKPFDASGKSITLKINGAEKTITMPGNAKFEAGKKTTLKVPIEFGLGTPITNLEDHKGTQITGTFIAQKVEKKFTMIEFGGAYTEEDMNINGENVKVYILGSKTGDGPTATFETGYVTIRGKAEEFIRLLPTFFYAATRSDGRAAMRLSEIKATVFADAYLGGMCKNASMTFEDLTATMGLPEETLTFDGLAPIHVDDNNQSIILYEDPIHKQLTSEALSGLLLRFDDDDYDDKIPTYDPFYELFTKDLGHELLSNKWKDLSTEAKTIADILTNKLKPYIMGYVNDLADLFNFMFGSTERFIRLLREDASLEVKIETCPIDAENGITDTRVYIWGLNSSSI